MLRKILPLTGLFVLVFIGMFLVLGGEVPDFWGESAKRAGESDFRPPIPPVAPLRNPSETTTSTPGSEVPRLGADPELEASQDPGPGQITGWVRAAEPDGRIEQLQVAVVPPAGRVVVFDQESAFEIQLIEAGIYSVTVWADERIPLTQQVQVVAGRSSPAEFELERGIRPKGRVHDEMTQRPVAGALIEWAGGLRAVSDDKGEFAAGVVASNAALNQITVSHPDYDRFSYVYPAITDAANIRLALSRGNTEVRGTFLVSEDFSDEGSARVRLYFTTGGRRDLRREMTFAVTEPFAVPRVHGGQYDLVVDFPGTRWPEWHHPLTVPETGAVSVEVPVGIGSEVRGHLRSRIGLVNGCRVALISDAGIEVAAVRADPQGQFMIPGVPPGTYRAKVHFLEPWFNTQSFTTDGRTPVELFIDCERRILVDR